MYRMIVYSNSADHDYVYYPRPRCALRIGWSTIAFRDGIRVETQIFDEPVHCVACKFMDTYNTCGCDECVVIIIRSVRGLRCDL